VAIRHPSSLGDASFAGQAPARRKSKKMATKKLKKLKKRSE